VIGRKCEYVLILSLAGAMALTFRKRSIPQLPVYTDKYRQMMNFPCVCLSDCMDESMGACAAYASAGAGWGVSESTRETGFVRGGKCSLTRFCRCYIIRIL